MGGSAPHGQPASKASRVEQIGHAVSGGQIRCRDDNGVRLFLVPWKASIELTWLRFAKDMVSRRFEPHKIDRKDMLGSFLQHGLSRREAETEATLQMSETPLQAYRTRTATNCFTAWPAQTPQ